MNFYLTTQDQLKLDSGDIVQSKDIVVCNARDMQQFRRWMAVFNETSPIKEQLPDMVMARQIPYFPLPNMDTAFFYRVDVPKDAVSCYVSLDHYIDTWIAASDESTPDGLYDRMVRMWNSSEQSAEERCDLVILSNAFHIQQELVASELKAELQKIRYQK